MSSNVVPARKRPHVVVVGGGFGGLSLVRKLKRADVDITLIDRHTYNTFQPLLYQVATASLNPGDITWFLRAVRADQKNVRFVKGIVTNIDHQAKVLSLHGEVSVTYDYLVLANGVTTNFFGTPGAEEFSLPLYKRSQALQVRDRLFENLEEFAINGQDEDLRIIVVGGGATGVETAGAFAEFRNNDMPTTYPELDRARIHVTLLEMAPNVLGPFDEKLRAYAEKSLLKRDVDLRLNTAVKEVREDGVVVETDGHSEFLSAGIVVWATGVTAHPTVLDWDVPQGRGGRIEVDEHLRVKDRADTFAIGDIAIGPDPLPQLAQPAIQGGKHVAKLIKAELKGKADRVKPFKYSDKGTMATIGKSSAVAEITYMPKLTGFPAWIIWVALHIATLLGNRNRFATLINLSSKYLFSGSHNAIVGETPYVVSKHKLEITPLEKQKAERRVLERKAASQRQS
ncbi:MULTISPECIES: NAD(P)/FAD-dependent oxidoreductase [unclassified Aeromicrobium]|uniref:NAD(P)/FAD-dependent oxidoreductase n=2 Tax=Aeromicrobium TaxID=2040 RepID=UPI0007021408|nr:MULTISPECIES: NAD(P)/FAD-dependent oxidoreductase [unclassified Aeromicrobium]KQO36425.1 NADH dehydrogenase [Aeromicrobium sp. Leaf245]KQP78353.1 NADH dehydrogenase [Aeromicrobium sp. Leaf289]KQP84063.1 NADH dehydrogenase [Aeromicrobium sp. Leaf291]RYY45073.1 MAG: NAD(P)/FAD-dependent oxidoreductase [Actinomycetales bacterium]